MNKFVYIASPYTRGDNFVNLQRQIECANELYDNGFVPISPLLNSVFCNMQKERDWKFWMEIDYALLSKCDFLIRLEGESSGADLEVDYALKNIIPVYFSVQELLQRVYE